MRYNPNDTVRLGYWYSWLTYNYRPCIFRRMLYLERFLVGPEMSKLWAACTNGGER